MSASQEGRHDAGGSSRFPLQPGVRGNATWHGPGDMYRPMLWRWWGEEGAPYVLWLGMNPSTAEADCDDNTIRIECGHTRRWGFTRYAKGNVMDLRATHPKRLLQPGTEPRSAANLACIAGMAQHAAVILLTFGALPKRLQQYGRDVVSLLVDAGKTPQCLGHTADGSPRHVRGLSATAQPIPFDAARYLRRGAPAA